MHSIPGLIDQASKATAKANEPNKFKTQIKKASH